MNETALSIHVRSTDPKAVADALREIHTLLEYEPADGEMTIEGLFTARPQRQGIAISKARDGWVSTLVSGGAFCTNILARALSKWLQATVLEIEVAGEEICSFMLIEKGEVVDTFRLAPETDADYDGDVLPLELEGFFRSLPSPGLVSMPPDLEQLYERAMAIMPSEMQCILERVNDGTATPAQDRKLERWVAENVEALTRLFLGPIQEAMPEIEWVEQTLGIAVDDDDEVEYEEEADDSDDVISIADYLDGDDYLQHYESILAPGVHPGELDDLLGEDDITAPELLSALLPMLGIAPIYARLDYPFVSDVPDAELADAGIEFVEHLKFQLADEE